MAGQAVSQLLHVDDGFGIVIFGCFIVIYLIGVLVQIPFLSTAFYTGPLVEPLGGVDISWIVGLLLPGVLYYAFGRASRRRAPPQLILPG